MEMYDRGEEDIEFLVGDNCATNDAIANLLQKPIIECESHKLNLACKQFLLQHADLIHSVREAMIELRKLKSSGLEELQKNVPQRTKFINFSNAFRLLTVEG